MSAPLWLDDRRLIDGREYCGRVRILIADEHRATESSKVNPSRNSLALFVRLGKKGERWFG
jgi:hypothetical protein